MKEILKDLCTISGVSGNENAVADYCVEYLGKYGIATKDFNNNVIAILGNENTEKTLLLDAHLDQIGLIVTEIDDKGFLKAEKCGGVDLRTLLGSPVTVHGKEKISSVICCMPPHLSDGKEDEAVSADNIWIDTGLPTDKVNEIVSLGDYITLDGKFCELLNNRVASSSLDNRAGVAVLFRVCQILENANYDYKVVILLSCQEETYATGAITKAFEFEPDEAICIDVSFAKQPGIDDQYTNIKLGDGPMICHSSTLDKNMSKTLVDISQNKNIPYQNEVCGGRTGTNADHISTTKFGVKTAVISIPQKNMHTQVETIDLNDIENTARLITEYIISGGAK